jgi:hypothetical protein
MSGTPRRTQERVAAHQRTVRETTSAQTGYEQRLPSGHYLLAHAVAAEIPLPLDIQPGLEPLPSLVHQRERRDRRSDDRRSQLG